VLIDKAIAGDDIKKLDIVIELRHADNAIFRPHFAAAEDRFCPEKTGNRSLDRVFTNGKNQPERTAVRGLIAETTRPAAMNPDIAGQRRQDTGGSNCLLAISPPLKAIA